MSDVTADLLSSWLDVDVVDVRSTEIGDGLVGKNLRLVPRYATDTGLPSSLVVKLPSDDPTSRATGIGLRNYEREVKFYEQVAGTVAIRVPHRYFSSWDESTGDFVLLMEDLAPAQQGNQLTGCGIDQARDAITELAALHAPRWDDSTLADIEFLSRRDAEGTAMLGAMYEMLLTPFLGTYATYFDQEGVDLVRRFSSRLTTWIEGMQPPFTVTHGDYRLDNLMFAGPSGGPRCAAVDWQSPGHGTGITDLAYFVGAGLLPADRLVHERSLVEHYRQKMSERGVDLDADWLWGQYRRGAFAGIVMTVVASQIVQTTERSEALFAAMGTRHVRHALDLAAEDLI